MFAFLFDLADRSVGAREVLLPAGQVSGESSYSPPRRFGEVTSAAQVRDRRASRPRKRRCLLKGCGRLFEPQRAQARYCGAECRRAAKRWRDSKSRRRYRKKESGRRKRREQSRRHRRRQQERKRRGEDVLVAVEAPAWVITQEKRSSSCDRPGCYESFERTRRSPLQRFLHRCLSASTL